MLQFQIRDELNVSNIDETPVSGVCSSPHTLRIICIKVRDADVINL